MYLYLERFIMRKLHLYLLSALLLVVSCSSEQGTILGGSSNNTPAAAAMSSYSDWDRAIRVDADLQNMFVATPTKIEKPIDMYMAMALALKYNYTRRMISYEQSIIEAGRSPAGKIPEILSNAGYINDTNSSNLSPELKAAWNLLDISTVFYQTRDKAYTSGVAFEQSRKVIHNILQETRALYWKALTAQRLLPLIDDMNEYMILEVDEINSQGKKYTDKGRSLPSEVLIQKRQYMEAVKNLAQLKREMETAEVRLASLMGFHPNTDFKLVGPEYGNFDLPELKSNLGQLEWLSLVNRPEMRIHDLSAGPENLKIAIKGLNDPGHSQYKKDPNYYNKLWSKKAREVGMSVLEDTRNPNNVDLTNLRRQRMTSLILSQVYVSWAMHVSSVEDYQILQEIANASEDIAEDTVNKSGSRSSKSHLESARAIEDEAKASLAYVDVQESLGNLYSTIGMDALPYYMLDERPSKIAVYLRHTLEKWRTGSFLPDNRPYMLDIPSRRPPVNLSSSSLMPDLTVRTGDRINVTIPRSILDKLNLGEKVTSKAGLEDDRPLPRWLNYDSPNFTLGGVAMASDVGSYRIKIYITDEKGTIGYVSFRIKVIDVFVPSMNVIGLTEGRNAEVFKRCVGKECTEDYIQQDTVGNEVDISPRAW